MKKVLITGGSGLIGHEVTKVLIERGFDVNVLDLGEVEVKNINYLKGSVLNKDEINKAMEGCDYVIHLAAVMGVSKAAKKPVECLDVNILGTKNVLDCCVKNNIKRILLASSSEVYGESGEEIITEKTQLNPKSEYGISKFVGEEYCKSYQQQFGLNYTIFRFFNVYGVKQGHAYVMSILTDNAILNKDLKVYGEGNQIRAFCNVSDAADAVVTSMTHENANNQTLNIGNSKEPITMFDLAQKINSIAGESSQVIKIPFENSDRTEKREVFHKVPNTDKAKELINFEAKIQLDEGLKILMGEKKNNIENIKKIVEKAEKYLKL